jgi:hypothetical protein
MSILLSSCATIISGTTADVHLDGNVDEPINVVTTKGEYRDLNLPATVKVKRRSLNGQHIQISSENYVYSDIVLQSSVNPWSIAGAFLYVPLIVDLATNAASQPTQNRFTIVPAAHRSQADSLHKADLLRMSEAEEAQRQIQLLARQLPEHYDRHELRGGIGLGNCQASHDKDKMIGDFMKRYELKNMNEIEDYLGDAFLQAGLEYHYRLNRKWEVGFLANWGISQKNYFALFYPQGIAESYTINPDDYALADEQCRFFVFAPSVRYTWKETNAFRSYSRIALGVLRHHLTFDYKRYPWIDTNNFYSRYDLYDIADTQTPSFTDWENKIRWNMAYQLTAIGATIGRKYFNFFGELGYGSLGIVRFGFGITF